MTKRERIMVAILAAGYKPQTDPDGDLYTYYQMKSIYFAVGDEDDPFVSVVLPQFANIEEGKETLVLAACNKMTREAKMAKTYVDHTFQCVSACCEFYFTDDESLQQNVEHSLRILGFVRTAYHKALAELSEE